MPPFIYIYITKVSFWEVNAESKKEYSEIQLNIDCPQY
jgi:hypothetical protein